MIHQIYMSVDYSTYRKQMLISSSKEAESDRVQSYPAIAKLFRLFEVVSTLADLYIHTVWSQKF